ncbi:hypothetical protein [Marinigracilibium pacificum]|uniref:DUF4340 domain-containing protein n=1 Tax=Marinigracilibium pacificum TaxID=2729599 RepID=A0A848J2V4_9BACT|nr:hypothetical protein [Marinigracilibium pacificum]NMM50096.1 hypothetical protein [Marinigracilibium pacificum]
MVNNSNKIRIAVIAVLLLAIFVLPGIIDRDQSLEVEPDKFAVSDTTGLDKIVLGMPNQDFVLEKKSGRWFIGDMATDAALGDVILAVINRLNIKRSVPESQVNEVVSELKATGVKVSVYRDGNLEQEYIAGGNANRTISYLADTDFKNVYIVNIPGYQDYVTGIFTLNKLAWKSKDLYQGDFRTMKSFAIVNGKGDTAVSLKSRGVYFEVNNLSGQLDSTRMDQYLGTLFNLRIDTHLDPKDYPQYSDFVNSNSPSFSFIIDDVSFQQPLSLAFYPVPGREGFYFCKENDLLAVFRQNDLEQLIVPPQYFQKDQGGNQKLF